MLYSSNDSQDKFYNSVRAFEEEGVPIHCIHSYLVHAGRGKKTAPKINGASVPLKGKLFDLLQGIYDASETECDIDIVFNHAPDGTQKNECRELILQYISRPNLVHGRAVAERLEKRTDKRSGLGLLFLIVGKEGHDHKIVLSRFPTDSAILADEGTSSLTIEFLERVFMKSKTSYKSVVLKDRSLTAGFWSGRAVDKQINTQTMETSNYWIIDFLAADFKLTPAMGTRRLASAIREATKKATLDIKNEIVAAATLAGSIGGQKTSIDEFIGRFALSNEAAELIRESSGRHVVTDAFIFDAGEFANIIKYRSIELDNGGVMTAPSGEFENIFRREQIVGGKGDVRFSTRGKIIDERFKKAL